MKYPVYQPALSGREKEYVLECLDSTWISSKGKFIQAFEQGFAQYTGTKYAAAVSNGTVALHLAMLALGIGPGDEVIVPTLTYIASVNAIAYVGATPVFADSLPDTWQLNPEDVKKKITPKTKAVMAVHLYGHPCEMDALVSICKSNNLFLVEDCAEAIGSKYKGKMVGGFGDIATFSFFGNKTITTGEGGMVICSNETLLERVNHLKGQGLAKYRQYWHDIIGYNYRMTNICAAIGLAQLEQVDTFIQRKKEIANLYQTQLKETNFIFHAAHPSVEHTYWMCSLLVSDSSEREALRNHLEQHGIETRPLFYPVHTMPMYGKTYTAFPVAEDLGWRGINLPSYPGLKDEEVVEICEALKSFKKWK
jgi:perosamine synthetase